MTKGDPHDRGQDLSVGRTQPTARNVDVEAHAAGATRSVPEARQASVLVAIPCYNEEIAIGSVVLQTLGQPGVDEVIVLDDGSTDDTTRIARQAGATVLQNDRNRGKGYSVRKAFRVAREKGADVLVLMDGDGQHDPEEIPQLVEPILGRDPRGSNSNGNSNGSAPKDIALGFRVGEMTEMPAWRRVGKRVLDYATATAAGSKEMLTDSQCGFRAFSRQAIETMATKLRENDFGIESEQLVIAREAGLKMQNVKIHCRYEGIENASTKGPVSHGVGVLNNVIEMVTQKRPLLFIGVPGILSLVAGIGLGIYTIQYWGWTDYFSMPYALGASALALVGMLAIMSALILNVVGRFEKKVERIVHNVLRGQD